MTSPPSGATHEAPAGAVGEDGIEHDAPPCLVALDAFSGPLDLLLFLVRRAEVDVVDIPIEDIADQYIATVAAWADLDLDLAGDFILMAATLLELKSRLIAPPSDEPQEDAADEEILDLRSGLVAKLLAYRRCKEAALALASREDERNHITTRQLHEDIPEDPDELGIDLENADPYALAATWEGILARIQGLGPRTVMADPLPLETAMAILVQTLETLGQEKLSHLFATQSSRLGRVTLLMAVLECVRQRLMLAAQHGQYEDIELSFRPATERAIAVELPPEPSESGKRRRRPPLITIASAVESPEEHEEGAEEVVETDEQRFMRELEESCRLESVLEQCADLDQNFARFWALKRGLPWPPPAPVVVEPVRAAEPVAPPIAARPPRRSAPHAPAADRAEAPVGVPVVRAANQPNDPPVSAAPGPASADLLTAVIVAEPQPPIAATAELPAPAPAAAAVETSVLTTEVSVAAPAETAAAAAPAASESQPPASAETSLSAAAVATAETPSTPVASAPVIAEPEAPTQPPVVASADSQAPIAALREIAASATETGAAAPEPTTEPRESSIEPQVHLPVVSDALPAAEPVSVAPAPQTPTHPESPASGPAAVIPAMPPLTAVTVETTALTSAPEPEPEAAPASVAVTSGSDQSDAAQTRPVDPPVAALTATHVEPDPTVAPVEDPAASTPLSATPGIPEPTAPTSSADSVAPAGPAHVPLAEDPAPVVAKDHALPAMVSISITPAERAAEPVTPATADAPTVAQVPQAADAAPAAADHAPDVRQDAHPPITRLEDLADRADAGHDDSGLIIELPEATAAVAAPMAAVRIPSERLRVIDPLSTTGTAAHRRADVIVDEQHADDAADPATEWVEIEAKIDAGAGTEAAALAAPASVALHLPELQPALPGASSAARSAADAPPTISVGAQSTSETTLSPTQQRTRATTLHPFPAPRPAKRQGRRLVLSATMLLIAASWYLSTHLPHPQAAAAEPLAAAAPASPIDLPKAPAALPIAGAPVLSLLARPAVAPQDADEATAQARAQLVITSLHGYLASSGSGQPIHIPLRATSASTSLPVALPAPAVSPAPLTSAPLLAWLASCAQVMHAYLPHQGEAHTLPLLAPAPTTAAPLAPDALTAHDAEALRALPYRQEPLMSSAAWLVIGAWRAQPTAADVP